MMDFIWLAVFRLINANLVNWKTRNVLYELFDTLNWFLNPAYLIKRNTGMHGRFQVSGWGPFVLLTAAPQRSVTQLGYTVVSNHFKGLLCQPTNTHI